MLDNFKPNECKADRKVFNVENCSGKHCAYRCRSVRNFDFKEQKYDVEFGPEVKKLIAEKGIDKNFGARPLRRAIQTIIEDKLAEEILDGNLKAGDTAKLTAKDDTIQVKVKVKK